MSRKRIKGNGKHSKEPFLMLPRHVTNHPDFISLSPRAIKLLIDIGVQYNGHNNGDLCAAMTLMKKRGWKSNDQRTKALKELQDKGLIILSRQGGRKLASLYALTWRPIDDCKRKIDISPREKPWRNFNEK